MKRFILALLLGSALSTQAAIIHLDENFNSGTIGASLSAPWTQSGTGTATYATRSGIDQSALIVATHNSSTAPLTVNKQINHAFTTGFNYADGTSFSLSADVWMSPTLVADRTQKTLRLYGATVNSVVLAVNFFPDMRVHVAAPNDSGDLVNHFLRSVANPAQNYLISEDVWYTLNVTLDTTTNLFDIELLDANTGTALAFVNGLRGQNDALATKTIGGFSAFLGGRGGMDQSMAIDNIMATSIPEPSVVTLMLGAAGAALFFRIRRRTC